MAREEVGDERYIKPQFSEIKMRVEGVVVFRLTGSGSEEIEEVLV